jgi:hypothetical protein
MSDLKTKNPDLIDRVLNCCAESVQELEDLEGILLIIKDIFML